MAKLRSNKRSKTETQKDKKPLQRGRARRSAKAASVKTQHAETHDETLEDITEEVEDNNKTPEEEAEEEEEEEEPEESNPESKEDGDEGDGEGRGKKRKKRATTTKQSTKAKEKDVICTERDPVARLERPSENEGGARKAFTVLSWNVNGLRATIKNGLTALRRMVDEEKPDLICLQETKLQEKDVEGIKEQDVLPGYDSAWTCSGTKKGYAGSAVFFPKQAERFIVDGKDESVGGPPKKKQGKISSFFGSKSSEKPKAGKASPAIPDCRSGLKVLGVRFGIGESKHDGEGRSITVEYDKFFVLTLYVPNSGQKLERLSYRTKEWDPALRAYVEMLESEGKPVVLTGDLNVAHLDLDIYNAGAKHILKTAGTTKEERESFDSWIKEGKMVDAFRRLHPNAKGAYTYWSVRTNARPVNKGLRLDYFLCSSGLFSGDGEEADDGKVAVHDCFQLEKATVGISDHCPVGLVLRI